MVSYTPAFGHAAPAFSLAQTEYLHRQIIDIRDVSEFELELPFVQSVLWRLYGDTAGTLEILVLDPLVAPSTVSSSVPIIVEVCGADDFELAYPYDWTYQPYCPAVPMSSYSTEAPGVYQKDPLHALGSVTSKDHVAAVASIGEKVQSFRQLLKRSVPLRATSAQTTTITTGASNSNTVLGVRPFAIDTVYNLTANSEPLVRGNIVPDLYSMLGHCYFFSHGGINVRAFPTPNTIPSAVPKEFYWVTMKNLDPTSTTRSTVFYSPSNTLSGNDRFVASGDIDARIDVVVPNYYTRTARVNHRQTLGTAFTTTEANGAQTLQLVVNNTQNTTTDVGWWVSRPIADDCGFSHWLGCPPVVLPNES